MTAVKLAAFEALLKKPSSPFGAILIYGADSVAVRERAASTVKRMAGNLDDPFRVVVIDDAQLTSDAGLLAEQVQSQSLLGGSKVIWVRSAEQAFMRAAAGILDGSVRGNIIVAEAGNLVKGSTLRRKFEESENVVIVPLYEQEASDAPRAVRSALSAVNLDIDEDALVLLVASTGPGTSLLMREVEKLTAYCNGRIKVMAEDVRAVCGFISEVETDDLVDATFAGNIPDVENSFQQLIQTGIDPSRMLTAALTHVTRLLDCLRNIDRGMRPEPAVRASQPPLFFRRQAMVQAQLSGWTLDSLLSVAASLYEAVNQSRLNPKLADEIANRSLLAVARIPGLQRRKWSS